jgi:hypothetical protein
MAWARPWRSLSIRCCRVPNTGHGAIHPSSGTSSQLRAKSVQPKASRSPTRKVRTHNSSSPTVAAGLSSTLSASSRRKGMAAKKRTGTASQALLRAAWTP